MFARLFNWLRGRNSSNPSPTEIQFLEELVLMPKPPGDSDQLGGSDYRSQSAHPRGTFMKVVSACVRESGRGKFTTTINTAAFSAGSSVFSFDGLPTATIDWLNANRIPVHEVLYRLQAEWRPEEEKYAPKPPADASVQQSVAFSDRLADQMDLIRKAGSFEGMVRLFGGIHQEKKSPEGIAAESDEEKYLVMTHPRDEVFRFCIEEDNLGDGCRLYGNDGDDKAEIGRVIEVDYVRNCVLIKRTAEFDDGRLLLLYFPGVLVDICADILPIYQEMEHSIDPTDVLKGVTVYGHPDKKKIAEEQLRRDFEDNVVNDLNVALRNPVLPTSVKITDRHGNKGVIATIVPDNKPVELIEGCTFVPEISHDSMAKLVESGALIKVISEVRVPPKFENSFEPRYRQVAEKHKFQGSDETHLIGKLPAVTFGDVVFSGDREWYDDCLIGIYTLDGVWVDNISKIDYAENVVYSASILGAAKNYIYQIAERLPDITDPTNACQIAGLGGELLLVFGFPEHQGTTPSAWSRPILEAGGSSLLAHEMYNQAYFEAGLHLGNEVLPEITLKFVASGEYSPDNPARLSVAEIDATDRHIGEVVTINYVYNRVTVQTTVGMVTYGALTPLEDIVEFMKTAGQISLQGISVIGRPQSFWDEVRSGTVFTSRG